MNTPDLNQEIARLQERQAQFLDQTNQEIEQLKQRLTSSDSLERLESKINQLELEKQILAERLFKAESELKEFGQSHQALEALRNIVRGQARALDLELRKFSNGVNQSLESLLAFTPTQTGMPEESPILPAFSPPALEEPMLEPVMVAPSTLKAPRRFVLAIFKRSPKAPKPVLVTTPQPEPVQPVQKEVKAPKPPKKRSLVRRLVVNAVALGIVGLFGYLGYVKYIVPQLPTEAEVAGANTTIPVKEPSLDPYALSYADVPYNKTTWENKKVYDLEYTMDVPTNATNISMPVGSVNIWYLRKNSFYMKASIVDDTTANLDEFWKIKQSNYNGKMTKSTFNGLPALKVEQSAKTDTSGTSYLISRIGVIMEFWIKDEPASTDDGQRIQHMLSTLTFTK